MLTSIKGVYENGTIRLMEEAPVTHSEVVVTFLEEKENGSATSETKTGVRFGSLAGRFKIGDDFNEPMDDLKEYM